MEWWWRLAIGVGVVVIAIVLARVADRAVRRRSGLSPETVTRYRVLRRAIKATIIAVGVLTALLIVPQIRAVAGGILASTAVMGLVVGFAARSTLANFVAGLLIAFNQPVRIGDDVEVVGERGTVVEIGLGYTTIRTPRGDRLLIPNEKLASEVIRNSTMGTQDHLAEVVIDVPVGTDLAVVSDVLAAEVRATGLALDEPSPEVTVRRLDRDGVSLAVEAWAGDERTADALESELRRRVHERLLASGIYPGARP